MSGHGNKGSPSLPQPAPATDLCSIVTLLAGSLGKTKRHGGMHLKSQDREVEPDGSLGLSG